jgi:putative tryptophan/tyrosine transport system substrate-binding protein
MWIGRLTRRDFMTALSGAAAWPIAARAQQTERMRRIGVLMGWPESDPEAQQERSVYPGAAEIGLDGRPQSAH